MMVCNYPQNQDCKPQFEIGCIKMQRKIIAGAKEEITYCKVERKRIRLTENNGLALYLNQAVAFI